MFRKSAYAHLHTLFVHFVKEDVKNLHETEVTPDQFKSRNMLKAFTAAAARARALYGVSKTFLSPYTNSLINTQFSP